MDKNTQQPVAWIDDDGMVFWKDGIPPDGTDLFISPTVPRDVLMAAVRDMAVWIFQNDKLPTDGDIADIADRYAGKVQPDVELVSYAPDMATSTLRIGEEQFLFDRHVDQPEPVNQQMLEALKRLLHKAYKQNWKDNYPSEVECAENAISAADAAQQELVESPITDAQIERHTVNAGDCPAGSKVMLVSSIRRLLARNKRFLQTASAQPVAVPDGYALVPVEPTTEMQRAGCAVPLNKAARHNAVYRAMLAAYEDHIDAQQASIAELEQDAARYRWLRDSTKCEAPGDFLNIDFEKMDAAIDAAMQKDKTT